MVKIITIKIDIFLENTKLIFFFTFFNKKLPLISFIALIVGIEITDMIIKPTNKILIKIINENLPCNSRL